MHLLKKTERDTRRFILNKQDLKKKKTNKNKKGSPSPQKSERTATLWHIPEIAKRNYAT